MNLFNLSSLETLLSVTLIELSWSMMLFFNDFLSLTLNFGFGSYWISMLVYGVILFLRVMASVFLLIGVLKNQINEHCKLIKICTTVVLDIVFITYGSFITIIHLPEHISELFPQAIQLGLFIFLRLFILSHSKGFITDLLAKEGVLFPNAGIYGVFKFFAWNLESFVKVLLIWEIVWGIIRAIRLFHILPNWNMLMDPVYVDSDIASIMDTVGLIFLSGIQFLSVQKKWKVFFILLIFPYLFASILFHGCQIGLDIDYVYRARYNQILALVMPYILGVAELILRLCGFVGMCGLVWGSKGAQFWKTQLDDELEKNDGVKEPTAMDPLLPTKEIQDKSPN